MDLKPSPYVRRVVAAIGEIIAHFAISAVSLLTIAGTSYLITCLQIHTKIIPYTSISLSEWMFLLEVISFTAINFVGVLKAVGAYWRT